MTTRAADPLSGFDSLAIALSGARRAATLVAGNGRFTYRLEDGKPLGGYNLLRHCGTAWAIADIAGTQADMRGAVEAADRAMHWLVERRTAALFGGLAVVGRNRAKLGGAALAILALAALNRAGAGSPGLEIAVQMGDFLLACQRDDGDFHHKIVADSAQILPFRSDYYTGEALFALARLFQATGIDRFRRAANASLEALAARNYGVAEQSHWMTYALAAMHEISGETALRTHAGRIIAAILADPSYRARQRTAPIACRVEAMMAYLAMNGVAGSPQDGPDRSMVLAAAQQDLLQLTRYRLPDGAFMGGEADRQVRIDFIQHAASAFIGFHRVTSEMGYS